jgi:hypothetical protein
MPPVGFEPVIPAIERQQIYAFGGTATGIDSSADWFWKLRVAVFVG